MPRNRHIPRRLTDEELLQELDRDLADPTEDASDEDDGWLRDEVDNRVDTSLTETVDPEVVV